MRHTLKVLKVANVRYLSGKVSKGMSLPLSLGHGMKYHSAGAETNEPRPLAVVAGWLGAKEKHMTPYLRFYHERNIDTISFCIGTQHVLFPERSMKQMEAVLDCASHQTKNEVGQSIIQPHSGIIFHHFSVGGFLYGQALHAMKKNPKFKDFSKLIKAQVFDSPPDYSNISKGIARSLNLSGMGEKLAELVTRGYLKVTHNTSGVLHRAASESFHGNFVPAPSLFFYSEADRVADWEQIVTVTDKWQGRGITVEHCMWKDTPHIQHGRVDPERYFGTLENFLGKHNVI